MVCGKKRANEKTSLLSLFFGILGWVGLGWVGLIGMGWAGMGWLCGGGMFILSVRLSILAFSN